MSKILGTIKILLDSSGVNEYLALDIEQSSIQSYIDFIAKKIDGDFIENKKKRDDNQYHITLLNAAQFGSLKKNSPDNIEQIITQFQSFKDDFKAVGIGHVRAPIKQTPEEIENHIPQNYKEAYFIVVSNPNVDNLRKGLFSNFPPFDLHCTLGFNPTDVHGKDIRKNEDSIIYTQKDIFREKKIKP